jgi:transcriptional regulator with XRE-family HTH domain
MKIGERIRQLRKERNVTAEQLAVRIERGSQTVFRWETGETSPRMKDIALIADTLGVALSDLLKGVTEEIVDRGAA